MTNLEINLKRMAELGLLQSLPTLLRVAPKQGRLRGKLELLKELATKELRHIPYVQTLYKKNIEGITRLLDNFGKMAKWMNNPTQTTTVISFFLLFLENSETGKYPEKIIHVLNDVLAYFEREGEIPDSEFIEGLEVFEIWKQLSAVTPPDELLQSRMNKITKELYYD